MSSSRMSHQPPVEPPSPSPLNREAVLDALAEGALVATGNARLARSLVVEYERRMMARGLAAWSTPEALPLTSWLLMAYEEASLRLPDPLPRVLSAEQEEEVWAGIIRRDMQERQQPPLRIAATARRARHAWDLLREWRLELADSRFGLNENSEAFRRWAQRFEARLSERGEVCVADVPALLGPLLAKRACPLPPRILLAGFYELTPSQQALAGALRAAGCTVDWVETTGEPGRTLCQRADDPRHELRLAAEWAHDILRDDPELRVGIVVPDLAARRTALIQELRRQLDPASLLPGAGPGPRPWNVSLGRPLAEVPVVATALRLLALTQPQADAGTLGLLLLSPHWALPEDPAECRRELDRRALLDRRIRAIGDARLPLATLRFHAGAGATDARPWHSPSLAARLGQLVSHSHDLPGSADAGAWAAAFAGWLKAADWGAYGRGGRLLDSHEHQAVNAWNALLSRFSSLADFAGTLSRGEALALLGRLAADAVFQPRAGEASVQALGLYEAVGQSFDRLWVMGLHDGAWPSAPGPDPFLPLGLQRERGMPHSGPDIELEWAARVTRQFRAAAPEAVFSYPVRDGNEALQCSPLIAGLPERAPRSAAEDAGAGWHQAVATSANPESVPTDEAVTLHQLQVPGGSHVFSDQAACPFRAFANHRLGAAPLERPQAGLNAMRRGTLAHRLLARLWADLETQAKLLALDECALCTRLRAHIDELLEAERRRSPSTYTARFRSVEAGRLEAQVLRWLAVERERSPFTVTAREQERRFETGGVSVRLFIDRIDTLDDASRVVLDYKTGAVRPSAWFGERPEQPQLPLYGVAVHDASGADGGGPVAAVAFAQIAADSAQFSGVVRGPGVLPGLPANRKGPLKDAAEGWPAVLDEWAAELERLAEGFRAGTAEVDPKHGLRTCEATYCELQPLCRVRERLPLAVAAAEEPETTDA